MTARVSEFTFFRTIFVLILLGLISVSTSTAFAADPAGQVKPYPLDYCIMDGKQLGAHPTTFVYKGQEIKTDDPMCKEAFYEKSGPLPEAGAGSGKKTQESSR